MNKIKGVALIILLLLLCGCATGAYVSHRGLNFDESQYEYDMSKGYVYFFRPCKIFGAARGVDVLENSQKIGGLNCSTYFVYQVEPGMHSFYADDWIREKEYLKIDVKAGERYFVKADLKLGLIDVKPSLTLMSEDYRAMLQNLKQVPKY